MNVPPTTFGKALTFDQMSDNFGDLSVMRHRSIWVSKTLRTLSKPQMSAENPLWARRAPA